MWVIDWRIKLFLAVFITLAPAKIKTEFLPGIQYNERNTKQHGGSHDQY